MPKHLPALILNVSPLSAKSTLWTLSLHYYNVHCSSQFITLMHTKILKSLKKPQFC